MESVPATGISLRRDKVQGLFDQPTPRLPLRILTSALPRPGYRTHDDGHKEGAGVRQASGLSAMCEPVRNHREGGCHVQNAW